VGNETRTNIPAGEFSTAGEGYSLVSNTIRQSLIFNAYEGKTVFNAIVLTHPIVLSELDLNYSGPTMSEEEGGPSRVSEFMFKARLLGEEGIPSPHDYIPDPCSINASYASGLSMSYLMHLISLHTTFYSATQQETQEGTIKPKVGDVVRIQLEKNTFGYNLATGIFLQVITDSSLTSGTALDADSGRVVPAEAGDRSECASLSSIFAQGNAVCDPHGVRGTAGGCFPADFFAGTGLSGAGGGGGAIPGSFSDPFPYILSFDDAANKVVAPTTGRLSSPFGFRSDPMGRQETPRMHYGIDIAAGTTGNPNKVDVVAIADGVIQDAVFHGNTPGTTSGIGNVIRIRHNVDSAPTRLHSSRYGHLHTVEVSEGDVVRKGQKIGTQGTTGGSTGDHVHFEVKYDNGTIGDPVQFLGLYPGIFRGTYDGSMTAGQALISGGFAGMHAQAEAEARASGELTDEDDA
jgi:murein DD-endopeptidase MepM/ murein hydrolase activator NlpD